MSAFAVEIERAADLEMTQPNRRDRALPVIAFRLRPSDKCCEGAIVIESAFVAGLHLVGNDPQRKRGAQRSSQG